MVSLSRSLTVIKWSLSGHPVEFVKFEFSKPISLAKSFAPKVRVNAISPGFTRTAMTENRSNEHKERMAKQTLLNRIAQPEEMAEVIFFLCVSGSYITGEIISVNGGNGYNYNT